MKSPGTGNAKDDDLLKLTQERLLTAQRIGKMGNWELDIASKSLWWSDQVYRIFSLTPDRFEPTYAGFVSHIHPADIPRFQSAQENAMSGQATLDIEHRIVTGDGETRWVHELGELQLGSSGKVEKLAGTVQDITARKHAEAQLQLLETAVSRLNDIVVITEAEPIDEPGPRIVMVNEAFERRTGYKRHEVLGRSPKLLQGAKTQRSELDRIRKALEHWQPVRAELINYTKSGEEFWLELDIVPIADATGWFTHWVSIERDITGRKRMDEDRDRLFNLSMDMLSVGSFDGYLTQVNPAWTQALGWSADELTTQPWLNFVHPQDRQATIQTGERLALGQQARNFQNRYRCKDGSERWLSWNSYPLLESREIFSVARDITGQKVSEAALADSRRAQTLLSRCNEALIRSESESDLLARVCQIAVEVGEFRLAWIGYASDDPQKLVVPQVHAGEENGYLSRARITWSEHEPAGRGPTGRVIRGADAVVVPDMENDPSVAPWLEAARKHGLRGVVCLPLKDSKRTFGALVLYMSEARAPSTDELKLLDKLAANLAFGIGTFRSRKERQIADSLLREQASLLDKAQDAILVRDLAHRVTYWNAGAERLYGWTGAEVIGRSVCEFFYFDLVAFETAMELLKQKGEWMGQLAHKRRDGGDVVVEARWTLLRDDSGQPLSVLVINTDITERLALEERLRQSQRLESMGQLTGGVAHDFNNLLTVILGNAELLTEQIGANAAQRALAETIMGAAQRGADLTQRLLAFARKQALDPKVTDVNRLLADLDGLLKRALGEHIEIAFVRGAGLWPALVDPAQLENAVLNLCLNARDAMPQGGRLTIETCNTRIDDDYASKHDEVKAGQYVLLAVSDTGTGVAPDHLARVFEPFFTTKEKGKGTGLGLAMVYGFVKQSGGHASIYSEPGHGTTVKLYLPQAVGQEPVAEPSGSDTQLTGGNETILMVEDDEFVRRYAEGQLRRLGYTVLVAENGLQALRLLRVHDSIDLLFTDVVMPGMGGRELAEQARKLRPGLRVLYTSGYTENAIVHHGRLDPGVLLLNKPYRRIELAQKIRAALAVDEVI